MKRSSKPFNPKLAEVFFKSGMIEACALYDGPLPEYEINEAGSMVLCKACDKYLVLLRNDGRHPDHYPNHILTNVVRINTQNAIAGVLRPVKNW